MFIALYGKKMEYFRKNGLQKHSYLVALKLYRKILLDSADLPQIHTFKCFQVILVMK
jgi:hypothetical protein